MNRISALLSLLVTTSLPAQESAPSTLESRRADKMARPVFRAVDWTTDLGAARQKARAEKKLIFAYFTRSWVA